MNDILNKLFSATAVYAVANLLQRGMMLFLLPLYARYFTKEEFGAMDLLYQGALILIVVTSLGMPAGLPRGIHLADNTEEDRRRLLGVLTVFLFFVSTIVCSLVWIFSDELSRLIFQGQGEVIWLKLTIALFFAMALQQFPLQILKAYQRSISFSVWSIITFIFATAGNLYLIVYKEIGLIGMLIANSAAFGIIGLAVIIQCSNLIRLNFDWYRLKPLLQFGLPMLPALLSRKILEVSDRYMLPHYQSLEVLGEYVMAVKVATIVEVLVLVPFLFAWQPFFYSIAHREDAKEIFAKVVVYFFGVALFVFMMMLVFHAYILDFIGNGEYNAASSAVMFLVLAALFNGIQYSISPGIHLKNKLIQEALLMILAAIVNLLLNLLLIPKYGAIGAAIATLTAFLFYLISTFILSQRALPINYNKHRLFLLLAIATCFMIPIYFIANIWIKFFLVLLFGLFGPGLDYYLNDHQKHPNLPSTDG